MRTYSRKEKTVTKAEQHFDGVLNKYSRIVKTTRRYNSSSNVASISSLQNTYSSHEFSHKSTEKSNTNRTVESDNTNNLFDKLLEGTKYNLTEIHKNSSSVVGANYLSSDLSNETKNDLSAQIFFNPDYIKRRKAYNNRKPRKKKKKEVSVCEDDQNQESLQKSNVLTQQTSPNCTKDTTVLNETSFLRNTKDIASSTPLNPDTACSRIALKKKLLSLSYAKQNSGIVENTSFKTSKHSRKSNIPILCVTNEASNAIQLDNSDSQSKLTNNQGELLQVPLLASKKAQDQLIEKPQNNVKNIKSNTHLRKSEIPIICISNDTIHPNLSHVIEISDDDLTYSESRRPRNLIDKIVANNENSITGFESPITTKSPRSRKKCSSEQTVPIIGQNQSDSGNINDESDENNCNEINTNSKINDDTAPSDIFPVKGKRAVCKRISSLMDSSLDVSNLSPISVAKNCQSKILSPTIRIRPACETSYNLSLPTTNCINNKSGGKVPTKIVDSNLSSSPDLFKSALLRGKSYLEDSKSIMNLLSSTRRNSMSENSFKTAFSKLATNNSINNSLSASLFDDANLINRPHNVKDNTLEQCNASDLTYVKNKLQKCEASVNVTQDSILETRSQQKPSITNRTSLEIIEDTFMTLSPINLSKPKSEKHNVVTTLNGFDEIFDEDTGNLETSSLLQTNNADCFDSRNNDETSSSNIFVGKRRRSRPKKLSNESSFLCCGSPIDTLSDNRRCTRSQSTHNRNSNVEDDEVSSFEEKPHKYLKTSSVLQTSNADWNYEISVASEQSNCSGVVEQRSRGHSKKTIPINESNCESTIDTTETSKATFDHSFSQVAASNETVSDNRRVTRSLTARNSSDGVEVNEISALKEQPSVLQTSNAECSNEISVASVQSNCSGIVEKRSRGCSKKTISINESSLCSESTIDSFQKTQNSNATFDNSVSQLAASNETLSDNKRFTRSQTARNSRDSVEEDEISRFEEKTQNATFNDFNEILKEARSKLQTPSLLQISDLDCNHDVSNASKQPDWNGIAEKRSRGRSKKTISINESSLCCESTIDSFQKTEISNATFDKSISQVAASNETLSDNKRFTRSQTARNSRDSVEEDEISRFEEKTQNATFNDFNEILKEARSKLQKPSLLQISDLDCNHDVSNASEQPDWNGVVEKRSRGRSKKLIPINESNVLHCESTIKTLQNAKISNLTLGNSINDLDESNEPLSKIVKRMTSKIVRNIDEKVVVDAQDSLLIDEIISQNSSARSKSQLLEETSILNVSSTNKRQSLHENNKDKSTCNTYDEETNNVNTRKSQKVTASEDVSTETDQSEIKTLRRKKIDALINNQSTSNVDKIFSPMRTRSQRKLENKKGKGTSVKPKGVTKAKTSSRKTTKQKLTRVLEIEEKEELKELVSSININERRSNINNTIADKSNNVIEDDVFKKPASDLVLKSGKWRRSLSIYKKSVVVQENAEHINLDENLCQCRNGVFEQRSKERNRRSSVIRFSEQPTNSGYEQINNGQDSDALEAILRNLSINACAPRIEEEEQNTARDIVLRHCDQAAPKSFSSCFPNNVLQNCQKIGEGVYGEVFLYRNNRGVPTVMKIIPIEGDLIVNGERQKRYDEIVSEIVIAKELSNLRYNVSNTTSGFVELRNVSCVKGKYPKRLIELWELFADNNKTYNDNPKIFQRNQLYIVLEFANAGKDLESFIFNTSREAYYLFIQIAYTLAVAEIELKFEHRDLHWGNILIAETDENFVTFTMHGREMEIPSFGLQVSVIDYTLSRINLGNVCIFNNLADDADLFASKGDYQFDIYRLMQERNCNDWERFVPSSNVLWLHYVLDKMMKMVRYKNTKMKGHQEFLKRMRSLHKKILFYKSASEFIEDLNI